MEREKEGERERERERERGREGGRGRAGVTSGGSEVGKGLGERHPSR